MRQSFEADLTGVMFTLRQPARTKALASGLLLLRRLTFRIFSARCFRAEFEQQLRFIKSRNS